ncbi:GAF domain-containing protein [Ornatilinea apprima]|uniref:GAF domain-containing protein n=1 Tax=Ornatilinea apprima TaxID=1134406 RepID=UPI00094616E5|nr:GAF domain-containing protein [Ornatilinea apprima]
MVPLRVLIIEDSEIDAELIIRQLKRAGYTVQSKIIEDEEQYRAALRDGQWDIIIADYHLPQFSAPAALDILQESGLDIPFIVVSGAIGEDTAVDLMKSGASDYLVKDRLARLGPAVERELNEARVRLERKRAYEALRENERNLRNSQRAAHVGHWVRKPQTQELLWSEELYRIFGVKSQQNGLDLYRTWQECVHPEDRAFVFAARDITKLNPALNQIEYRIIRPDGTLRHLLSLLGETNTNESGQIIQVSGVVQDITERKQAEFALLEKMKESQKRASELEAITRVSSSMRLAQTPGELVEIILQDLTQLLNASFASLAFLEGNRLVFETNVVGEKSAKKLIVPVHNPLFLGVIQSGKPLTLRQPDEQILSQLPEELRKPLLSLCCLEIHPLVSSKDTVGIILLGFDQKCEPSNEQVNLIEAIAQMAGNAINRMLAAEEVENLLKRREQELESIYQITSAASKPLDTSSALQEALTLTLNAAQAVWGCIFLLNEEENRPEYIMNTHARSQTSRPFPEEFPKEIVNTVVLSRRPAFAPEPNTLEEEETGLQYVGLPMRIQNRVAGVLILGKPHGGKITVEELTLLSFIADHLALVIENARLYKKAEQAAIAGERSRLARELHDSVTQLLYSANLYAAGAQQYAALGNLKDTKGYLEQIGGLTQQALKEMRLLVYELRTSEITKGGLIGALQNRLDAVERRSSMIVDFHAPETCNLPPKIEDHLYRIALEALNNTLKHAGASHLWIGIHQDEQQIELVLEDDGCGFDPTLSTGGIGLNTMRERSEMMNGTLNITSRPGKGTRVEAKVPLTGGI